MKQWKFVIFLLCLLANESAVACRVLVHNSVVFMRKSGNKNRFRGIKSDFKALFERRLNDAISKGFTQRFSVNKNDNYKKLKFMRIIATILKTAKARHLKVKNIKLGSHLKKVFENDRLTQNLAEFINDPNFLKKYKAEKRKYKRFLEARKQRLVAVAKEMQRKQTRKAMTGGSKSQQNFNFEPGFAGMPFPPFMMNGPHFHPPMNITINALPNPNPRTENDPVSLEYEDLNKQKNDLKTIRDALEGKGGSGDGLNDAINNLKSASISAASKSFTSTTSLLT
jgi:hypothetical protein